MSQVDTHKPVHVTDGMSRRNFLQAGSLALTGLTVPQLQASKAPAAVRDSEDRHAIFLLLVGGPSQLDTFDPKPDAPSEVRGPFRPIRTNVPGIEITEIFPRTARIMDKVALVRSLNPQLAGSLPMDFRALAKPSMSFCRMES